MDIDLIRKLVTNLSQLLGDNDIPAQQQFSALQCQLLLYIYDKLDSIDESLVALEKTNRDDHYNK